MALVSIAHKGILKSAPIWALSTAMYLFLPTVIYVRKATAVLFAVVLLVLAVDWFIRRWALPKPGIAELGLAGFVAFATLSSAWSLNPGESLGTACAFAVTMGGAWLIVHYIDHLSPSDTGILRRAFVIGGMIGYASLAFEYVTSGLLRRSVWTLLNLKIETAHLIIFFKPAVAIGVLYLWPWSIALLRTVPRLQAIVLIAAVGVLLAIYQTGSAVIALLLGVSFALLSWVLGARARLCFGIALIVMVLSTSWIARILPDPTQPGSHLEVLSNSAIHRVDIWRTAGRLSADSPLVGIGFDGSRMLFDGATSRVVSFLPDRADGGFSVLSEPIPLHPHNAVLQVWLETGLIGTLLFALFLVSVQTRLLSTASIPGRIAGVGFFISALAIACLSFGAWQSWWLCSLVFMSAALKSLLREADSVQRQGGT